MPGVVETAAGYAGGTTPEPSYKDVCGGATGHAEVVEVTFDPERVTFRELLEAFFAMHNPAQPYLNAGHTDRNQYRSLILTHSEAQAAEAKAVVAALDASKKYRSPVVTQTAPLETFWRAEEFHQRYMEKRNLG